MHRKRPHKDTVRRWPSTSQGEASGATKPDDTLDGGLSASSVLRNIFLLYKPPVCHGGLSLLMLIVFNSLCINSFADVSKRVCDLVFVSFAFVGFR